MKESRRQAGFGLEREEIAEVNGALRDWFSRERGEELGELAADLLRQHLEETAARVYYDRGIAAASALVRDRTERMLDDLDLQRRPPARR